MKSVFVVASGYEWVCPECRKLNHCDVLPLDGPLVCEKCARLFIVGDVAHAY